MSSSCGSSSSCSSSSCSSQESQQAKMAQQENAITRSLGKIKHKILVMSGKGGVGKSTVSVNLALGLAKRGHQVGLMDVDLHGPDVIRMLNMKGSMEPPATPDALVPPLKYNDNLKVVSLEYMMKDRDEAIIWRGPLKIQAIRQFVADMDWGELDYLIIDAPPGTGDEPLSVAQTIPNVTAIVVTTPQKVALADVRKSINFCKTVEMEITGVIENMSGFVCPHCNQTVDIFKTGGGEELARDFDLPFLGRVPMDPKVVIAGDDGVPYLSSDAVSPATKAFDAVVTAVENRLPPLAAAKPALNMAAATSSCGCGGGGCNPAKCDC
ncbi:MAG: Mrp/NBP35 family ATP-binding protein [Proteobacteria bacterium]|nr:Mrp/NBP35 family ATP-binding protein [Desulfocapsa sp.]MBU3944123.1 Mrp/NBP35 family ATP-binding protein [Pseudomonadota bacterium]MBU3983406.1 Mrp/NBP35 family ATP-binding protein [Pseudomonadota bacterium]MBU4029736.1 Mrp/NBP35 family ATP-binding protein [Pseudomonadota bacterium]MBU4043386.1 Mrp/NBP35 family ATP-binding protein [Pseudomonadota bacterium]